MTSNQSSHISSPTAPTKTSFTSVLWPLLGAVGVLLLVVTVTIVLSLGRSENSMVRLLVGEGSALIHAVESSVRMNMRQHVPVQLQSTLDELVAGDVRFVSILMPDGTILAHNDETRLGSILHVNNAEMNEGLLKEISQKANKVNLRWFIANVDGKETFVVYREFTPFPKQQRPERRKDMPRFPPIEPPFLGEGQALFKKKAAHPLIFLGLDISPFEMGQRQDRVYLFSLTIGVVLMGAALLLALYYAQRAQESRRRQFLAEGQVRVLEEEVRRKEKMAAIGNLAAGVAHEIRNPLSSIKGYATYFGQRFPEGSEDRNAAGVMVREVERLNRVITDLIGLSRPTDIHAKPTDIFPVLDHSLRLLQQDAEKKNVSLTLHRPKRPLPRVLLDADRFEQAVLNICLNAIEAMPEGGRVILSTQIYKEKFLALEIRDTGQGIEEQHLRHIFDPYFTTKGHGTGLGLATVHKIVEAHKGEISVTSRHQGVQQKTSALSNLSPLAAVMPSGTTVRILLPLAEEKGDI